MPSTISEGSKRRALPFKAPRPVAKTSTFSATAKGASKSAAKKTNTATASSKVQKRDSNGVSKPSAKSTAKGKSKQIIISSDEEEGDELDEDDDGEEEEVEEPRRKSAAARSRPFAVSDSDDNDVDMEDSDSEPAPVAKSKSKSKKRTTDPLDEIPGIPPKLLTRLLYEGFEDKDMKIGKDAMAVVGKYMETFVREALARAKVEREEDGGDGFLQVEDLEKMAPQLLLDF